MKEEILLDLDGTLLDTRERHYKCYSDILETKNETSLGKDRFWELKRNVTPVPDILKESRSHCEIEYFQEFWKKIIEEPRYLSLDRPYEGVIELMSRLSKKYYLVLITMRNNAAALDDQLVNHGFTQYLDEVILVDNSKLTRKSQALKARKNIHVNTVLWVGDTEQDICSAKELVIPVCAVTSGIRSEMFLRQYNPDYLLPDITYIEEIL